MLDWKTRLPHAVTIKIFQSTKLFGNFLILRSVGSKNSKLHVNTQEQLGVSNFKESKKLICIYSLHSWLNNIVYIFMIFFPFFLTRRKVDDNFYKTDTKHFWNTHVNSRKTIIGGFRCWKFGWYFKVVINNKWILDRSMKITINWCYWQWHLRTPTVIINW